jgi:hypothetical protein
MEEAFSPVLSSVVYKSLCDLLSVSLTLILQIYASQKVNGAQKSKMEVMVIFSSQKRIRMRLTEGKE